MMRCYGWGVTLGLLICLMGCGDRKHPAALQGTWKMQMPAGVESQLSRLPGGIPQLSLTLSPNGEMSMGIAGRQNNGRWEVDGQNLKFSGSSTAAGAKSGTSTEQSIPFRIEDSGKTLKMTRNNQEVAWTKQ